MSELDLHFLCVDVHIYSKSGVIWFPVILQVYESFLIEVICASDQYVIINV
jgi:hypothetical protein